MYGFPNLRERLFGQLRLFDLVGELGAQTPLRDQYWNRHDRLLHFTVFYPGINKKRHGNESIPFDVQFNAEKLDGTGYFVGAQATGAGMNVAGRATYNCLDALDIGFPGAIAPSMGVGNLDSERDTLTADVAFSHRLHLLLYLGIDRGADRRPHPAKSTLIILSDFAPVCKLFSKSGEILPGRGRAAHACAPWQGGIQTGFTLAAFVLS